MSRKRKTWQEKLANEKGYPKLFKIDRAKSKRWGHGTFVIPAPMEVNELMARVPKGKITTLDELRKVLAHRHEATIACPITTGIFAWIAAHAAAENQENINPYWRTLKSKGELNPKYPGGIAVLKRKLAKEGHVFVQKGKRLFVKDYQDRLAVLNDP
jgi:alkylated DNA nucleotide flippase Atl1